ncbi:MAG: methyltransferase domain-containing protein [Candidatus Daviesbacteria bacterium]|nr:methyltransferase domain-containing protein [Candidatus Daviesbacteria bacterium]
MFSKLVKDFFKSHIAPDTEGIRERWTIDRLKKLPPGSIIDVGAGEMPYKHFCGHLKYTSQDFGKYGGNTKTGILSGKYNSKNVDIISDITKIPVKNNSFDYVLCTEVFEHIPDPLTALKELSRINKKGGKLILTAPFASMTHFYPYFFYSGFSEQFYRINLSRFGYSIKELYIFGNYFDWLALEIVRLPYLVFRYSKITSILLTVTILLSLPLFLFLRIASKIFPQSKDILSFGICVVAIKN